MFDSHQLLAGVLAQAIGDRMNGAERSQLRGGHLDFTGAVQVIHDVKRVGDGAADRQQAVALQDQGDILAERALILTRSSRSKATPS